MIDLSRKNYKALAYLVIFARIVLTLFIWVDPFIMPILFQLFDAFDYALIMNANLMNKSSYQRLDKFLDFYYLFIMFLVSIYCGNIILIGLFIYRPVGFLLVLITQKRIFFVFFNNTFEWMFNIFSFGYVYNPSFLESVNDNVLPILLISKCFQSFISTISTRIPFSFYLEL